MLNPIPTIITFRLLLFSVLTIVSVTDSREQVPLLNSCTSAQATVYLDFDGQHVNGTIWNENGPIEAMPAGLSSENITEIFNRIADDYRIFNLAITTDSCLYNRAPINQRIRIIFTPTSNWCERPAGGISFTGSFTWGDDTPGWVFNETLGNNPKYIAACASHEIGHALGLQHQSLYDEDGRKITEYSGGTGSPETDWAPIMGIGYYKNCTIWYTGQSAVGCDSIQSDLQVIAGSPNNFGFRRDDYGDAYTNAFPVGIYGENFSIKGMINSPDDKDAFRLNITSRSELLLNSFLEQPGNKLKNLNEGFKITLLNAHGNTIGVYSGLKFLSEGLDIVIEPGVYYFVIEDVCRPLAACKRNLLFYALSGTLIDADNLKRSAWLIGPSIPFDFNSDMQERNEGENLFYH